MYLLFLPPSKHLIPCYCHVEYVLFKSKQGHSIMLQTNNNAAKQIKMEDTQSDVCMCGAKQKEHEEMI